MKKILLSIICVMAAVFAQAEGHMMFKGIEIDGDLESFVKQLEGQGFTQLSAGEDYCKMTGTFTAENVQILVNATHQSNIVYSVMVVYSPISPWPSQEQHYRKLVESLKNKYGKPSLEIWDVDEHLPEHYIREEKSTVRTHFECGNGLITIGIMQSFYYGVSTCIIYKDDANYAICKKEVESDL